MGEDLAHRPEQHLQQAQRMHAEIVQRAIARAGLAFPIEQRLRVGHEILVHFQPHMVHRADAAIGQDGADLPDQRVLDIIVAQDRHPARILGGRRHALGIGQCHGHGLFAPDMLARFQRGNGHFGVEGIGRGHRNHVHIRVRHQFAPVARGLGKAEFPGLLPRDIPGHLGQVYKGGARPVPEHCLDARPGKSVAFAHIAGADEPDADR